MEQPVPVFPRVGQGAEVGQKIIALYNFWVFLRVL